MQALAKEEVGTLKAKADKPARLENIWAEYQNGTLKRVSH
jgi:hypothetical protein